MRLLLIEDDKRISANIAQALVGAGYSVENETDGEAGWRRGESEEFDAVVLDLGLPSLDGLTILKRWRKAMRRVPVLILTARGHWEERVDGIEAGADDYLIKPFRMEELVARVRALIRRTSAQAEAPIQVGELTLDARQKRVSLAGTPVSLTPQEYRLIAYLMQHPGRVVDQLELTEHLYAQDYERDSNSIEVLVGRVRRKLGTDSIRTRRGFGYFVGDIEA